MAVQRLVLQRNVETTEQSKDRHRHRPGQFPVQQDHGQPRAIEADEQSECWPLDPTAPLCPRHRSPPRILEFGCLVPTLIYRPGGLGPAMTLPDSTYARLFHDTGRFRIVERPYKP